MLSRPTAQVKEEASPPDDPQRPPSIYPTYQITKKITKIPWEFDTGLPLDV
jgi:hypothetical protein